METCPHLNWDVPEDRERILRRELPVSDRDVDRREVDFVIVENRWPIQFVECKWDDGPISTGLRYLKKRFPQVEAWQISATGKKDYITPDGIRACPSILFLRGLL